MWRQVGDISSFVKHLTAGRAHHTAQQVEERGFTRSVGSDDRVQDAFADLQADIVHCDQTTEFFAQVSGFEEDLPI